MILGNALRNVLKETPFLEPFKLDAGGFHVSGGEVFGIMSLTNFAGGRDFAGGGDAALRRPRPAGRNERGKSDLSPSPDTALGDEDSAARCPYLD
jgi:hypothetical protein